MSNEDSIKGYALCMYTLDFTQIMNLVQISIFNLPKFYYLISIEDLSLQKNYLLDL